MYTSYVALKKDKKQKIIAYSANASEEDNLFTIDIMADVSRLRGSTISWNVVQGCFKLSTYPIIFALF